MQRHSGFTLLEIMLVLVLVSLASVAVISTLPVSAEDGAKKQAQALFHRVQLLNEEAMLSGRDFGLNINTEKSTYSLMSLSSDGWQALVDDQIPTQTELDEGIVLDLQLGGSDWQQDDRLFEPGSLFDEEMFAEFEEEKKLPPPQLFIMSSGEVTPFVISLYPETGSIESDSWQVVAKENGQIVLFAPGEREEEDDDAF
jgi:general secretion pathway protein H